MLAFSISKQLYRCPGCRESIAVGREHVVVRYETGDGPYHEHWHRTCALEMARRGRR